MSATAEDVFRSQSKPEVTTGVPGVIDLVRRGRRRRLRLIGTIDAAVVRRFEATHGAEPVDAIDARGMTSLSPHGFWFLVRWLQESMSPAPTAPPHPAAPPADGMLRLIGFEVGIAQR